MLKIELFKNNDCIARIIDTDDAATAALAQLLDSRVYGQLEHTESRRNELTNELESILIPADFTVVQTDVTAQLEQASKNAESLEYLASTDWYIIRRSETDVPVPVEILTARATARAAILN